MCDNDIEAVMHNDETTDVGRFRRKYTKTELQWYPIENEYIIT